MKMIRDDSGERDGWWLGDRFHAAPKVGQVWERGGAFYLIAQVSKTGLTLEIRRCARDGSGCSMYGIDMRTRTLFEQFAIPPHRQDTSEGK